MVCEMHLLALLTVVLDLDAYDDRRRVCRQSAFRTPHNHRLTGLHSTPSNVSAASCRTVRSSTREWRLLDVRVTQTQAYHRGNLSSRRSYSSDEDEKELELVFCFLNAPTTQMQKAASDRTTLKHASQLDSGDWRETYAHSRGLGCVSRDLRPCGTR